ncbi:glycosyltransferase family 2 protein [Nocardioides sp. HM23]|uniref:glycosyltransferase family 2 protein n=1 Tax=Nocardioides bizhenqiangii TaxID=3095076 RepID=UPI002ACAE483|nr:glycosyltransferase family 2 protein [Nocardioides sp. HM23]MDZ5621208.1 glycosyltransferase family 2 protein [Nocardioides sp. HM23]
MSDVSVVLVSHDGASWLTAVLEGIRAQTAPVAGVVAVDTGSKDGSADLIESALRAEPPIPVGVLRESGRTSYPEAVALASEALPHHGLATEWIWLLHDDSNPAPDALEQLLRVAAARPEADFLGPKLREWPSLKRLLEVGVTISGTGRRETGLERGEYDQGQHDQVREVLAVNSAGLLVRRTVLEELGGYDRQLPMFGNDIDLGWRAAAAGHTTLVVPRAVVFHAEAAHRGSRRTPLTGRHTHYQERRAALFTLLANCRGVALPFQALRLALGSLLRMLGFIVVRSVGEALDELAALVSVYSRPGPLLEARRRRRSRQSGPADRARLKRLLAPRWLPYRHGLDFVSDLAAAATNQAADVAERRRAAAADRDPSPPVARHKTDDDEDFEDTGLVARFLTDPVAVALAVAAIAFVIGARDAFGTVSGGALSPVPDGARDWWALHHESWHPIGFGSAVPAPPYVLPLALLASVLGTETTMTVLLVAAAPLALWGAWRFLRVVGRLVSRYGAPRWLLLWGSVSYALVPLVAGAWGGGRWGIVVAAAVLPWLAHAALGFAEPEATRRWRAAWRTGFLLALLSAVAPVMWWLCAILGVVVVAASAVVVRGAIRDRSVWGPPATALAVPALLLAPWWLPAVWEDASGALFLDIGRWPTPSTDGVGLAVGRLGELGELGAPWWLGLALPALAVLALIPRPTRIGVVLCWLVAAVAALVAVPLGLTTIDLTGAATQQAGLGPVLLVVHGAWITAALLGGLALTERSPSPLVLPRIAQAVTAVVGVAAAVVPVAGLVWFAGWGGDDLQSHPESGIPVYMSQAAEVAPERGILVIRGSVADGLTYQVERDDGPTVGEDEVAALTAEDREATALIGDLVTAPAPEAVAGLTERGIRFVVQPAPADAAVATRLDATAGLVRASAEDRSTRAWQVLEEPEPASVEGPRSWPRIGLLVLQAVAIAVVAVLCLPTMRRSGR